jgi:YidC/Oxa1 family membrane protein insertase
VENRRLLIFFLASVVILLAWQWLMPAPARPPVAREAASPTPASSRAPSPVGSPVSPPAAAVPGTPAAPAPPPVAAGREERVVVDTEEFRAEFTNRGAQLLSFRLKEHRDERGQPLELVRAREEGPWPLGLVGADLRPLPVDDVLFASARSRDGEGHEVLRFDYRGPAGSAHKVVRILGPGLLGLEVESNAPGWGLVLGPGVRNPTAKELDSKRQPRLAIYRTGGKVETVLAPKAEKLAKLPVAGLTWIGLADNYFLSVLVPESPLAGVVVQPVAVRVQQAGRPYRMAPFDSAEALAPADSELPRDLRVVIQPRGSMLTGTAYVGAKQYDRLAKLPWGLEDSLQWGIWGFLSRPLLWALLWIHDHMVANYGWAIMLLTLGLRVILFPLTWSSQRSMLRMQALQPQMQAIRQKYKGKLRDKNGRMDLEAQRRMNEEMQELFRAEGANPYGGCLPMIVQIPVFFALFAMLRSAVELRHAPWAMWIHDLSEPDPFLVLPIIMGASQVYQQRLTPMSGDPMQRRMMQLFPFVFTIFSLGFPAGLVLYWTVNNAVTIAQTVALNRLRKDDAKPEGRRGKRKRGEGRGERT